MNHEQVVVDLQQAVKSESTPSLLRAMATYDEAMRGFLSETQYAFNGGENTPEAYHLEVPQLESTFFYRPATADIYITMGRVAVANGLSNGYLPDLVSSVSTKQFQVFSVCAREILEGMVNAVQRPEFESPLTSLRRLVRRGYPNLQTLLSEMVDRESGNGRPVRRREYDHIWIAPDDYGWVFANYHVGKRLDQLFVVPSQVVRTDMVSRGLSVSGDGQNIPYTEIYINAYEKDFWSEWVWPIQRVQRYDSGDHRAMHMSLGDGRDDRVEAYSYPLSVLQRISDFEQPAYPWA